MFMKINFWGKRFLDYTIERKNTVLKPVEPISKIEPLKPVCRDTVTFSAEGLLMSSKSLLIQRINATLNICKSLVDKYETFDQLQQYEKSSDIFMVKEFQARLETFLSLLDKRTTQDGLEDLFEQIEFYFYKIDVNLPRIIESINGNEKENKKGLF